MWQWYVFGIKVLGGQVGVECSREKCNERLRLVFTRVPNRVLRSSVEYYCVQTDREGEELISQPIKNSHCTYSFIYIYVVFDSGIRTFKKTD